MTYTTRLIINESSQRRSIMEKNLCLKTVSSLYQYSFFVPAYQRGYRWTMQEVEDLLNDIDEFHPREIANSDEKTWYCLQPLVIKKRQENGYELIDGQQRLTTVYLILYYLNQDFVIEKRDSLFAIDYQTRKGTKEFLSHPEQPNDTYVDFYYISEAYRTIENWFNKRDLNFDKGEFRSKLKFNTKFIWYETSETETIPVFSRLNIGKISLTNSELIKALFLNSSNYGRELPDKIRQRQFEIAAEWDGIESGLQDNKLWFFINDEMQLNNRIELIFNLIADNSDNDTYATFRFFNSKLQIRDEKTINKNWEIIKDYYQRFVEWYHNREWYHKIGFILYTKISSIKVLYSKASSMGKADFSAYLDDKIKEYYIGMGTKVSELQYGDKETKSILLLYNLITMLRNDHDGAYFPFDSFKAEKWDIEHITSVKNDVLPDRNERQQWLEDATPYIDSNTSTGQDLIKKMKACSLEDDAFRNVFYDVNDYFNSFILNPETNDIDDINGISNLTLLDSYTNRSYKNSVFPIKRKTIIERDKEGAFIPLCTKNTFLKYFSDYPPKISFWTSDDRQKYEDDLVKVLDKYVEVE